jgi:hypothetical protein
MTAPMRPVSTPAPADLEAAARHAQVRPTPVPPEPAPPRISTMPDRAPGSTAAGAAAVGAAGMAAAGASGFAPTGAGAAASTAAGAPTAVMSAPVTSVPVTSAPAIPPGAGPGAAAPGQSDLFPDPNAPRTITVGTHVLGVLVGILLPLASTIVAALGISRILVVEVDGWVAKVDVLGIVLVTLGALLLLACVLLSLWTPSVGLVGGGILTLAGGFALYAPGVARTAVLDVFSSEAWKPTVEQTVVVATSGTVVVIGVMLLGGGIVSSVARRHGIRLGAFRERHRNA